MSPTYNHNDYIVSAYWPFIKMYKGHIVVVSHPTFNTIVKRIKSLDNQGRMQLSGDNLLSTESEKIGWVTKENLLGRVIFHIPKH